MKRQVRMIWAGGRKFSGVDSFGNTITTDISKDAGGQEEGHSPAELVLFALAGCTGIDVVGIMDKMRQPLESLEIEITAENNDEYPRAFHSFEVKYVARGRGIDPERFARAIQLSEEKYCIVSHTLKHNAAVTTSYEILEPGLPPVRNRV
jgi:putative redox protein